MNTPARATKVLIVDDEPFALKLLSRQLNQLGFEEVFSCQRAQEALAMLEDGGESIDLVCSDLQMPEMDGVEFVRLLARARYEGNLMLVSGENPQLLKSAERLASAQGLRVLGSLTKPLTQEQLRECLSGVPQSAGKPAEHSGAFDFAPEDLKAAISNGEIVNYYQPKVATATGAIVGAEALVRWRHPRLGLIAPACFIGVAEEHRFIDELTHGLLKAALACAQEWKKLFSPHFKIAINCSMDSLKTLQFPEAVARIAEDAGAELSDLVVEVTETRLTGDRVASLDVLTRLRLKGASVSMDEFGTRQSSLSQLRDVPFDELKIDRSFVQGALRDASQRAIVEASVTLANRLGIRTVATGVENVEDWTFVRTTRCEVAQGFFIARPMPADDLPRWAADWRTRLPDLLAEASI
ncbi:EAL domain-containing response regulator [Trinickia mobilis]|uniref:EAL domain-containing response regulator n=1 Tax=Trinickia mobilis TaxID=2816356 RepID=UPI001A8FFB7B|nr:EAL domain-containing response regulator [Trinickia mobilis]